MATRSASCRIPLAVDAFYAALALGDRAVAAEVGWTLWQRYLAGEPAADALYIWARWLHPALVSRLPRRGTRDSISRIVAYWRDATELRHALAAALQEHRPAAPMSSPQLPLLVAAVCRVAPRFETLDARVLRFGCVTDLLRLDAAPLAPPDHTQVPATHGISSVTAACEAIERWLDQERSRRRGGAERTSADTRAAAGFTAERARAALDLLAFSDGRPRVENLPVAEIPAVFIDCLRSCDAARRRSPVPVSDPDMPWASRPVSGCELTLTLPEPTWRELQVRLGRRWFSYWFEGDGEH